MLTTDTVLQAIKARHSLPSNAALARFLGVPEKAVARWHTGRNLPDDLTAERLAVLAGVDAGAYVAAVHAARANDDAARDLWAGIARRLQAATATAGAVILSLGVVTSPDAAASVGASLAGSVARGVCILCKAAIAALGRRLSLFGTQEFPTALALAGR